MSDPIEPIPGGIIQHGEMFGIIVELFRGTSKDGEVARFFPTLQTVIDKGDAGAYARFVIRDRLSGFDQRTPHVLMQMVMNDEIVPNISNLAFAQSLGVPLLGDELLHIPSIPNEPALPIAENMPSGHTGGVFQFDLVSSRDTTELEPATHDNVGTSDVGVAQSMHFMDTFLSTGVAEILDPYRTLGIKP